MTVFDSISLLKSN